MAPHVIFEVFDKPLKSLPLYFDQNNDFELNYFFNRRDGLIYEIKELKAIQSSEYSGCVEVRCCLFNDMAQNGVSEVASDVLSETGDPFQAAKAAVDAFFPPEHQDFAAIYLFKDFLIKDPTGDIVGKQIKAARIDDEYAATGISKEIYAYLAKKYEVLVCDNHQTPEGHSLWAYGISKWGRLRVYNCITNEFVGFFENSEENPDLKPWSVPFNYPMQDERKFRHDVCEITDIAYHFLVLVVIASEVGFNN